MNEQAQALTTDDHEEELVRSALIFARDSVAPNAARWEADRRFPRETFEQAAKLGLTSLLVPPDLGGQGVSYTTVARIQAALAAADFGFAFGLVVHNNLASNIAKNGTPAQKAAYLPDMIAGRRLGAFLLTEPGAGSDAASIACAARQDGDGWAIDGEKAWVTNGATADILSAYVQTDPAAGAKGIACFLVDGDAEGMVRSAPYELVGGHSMGVNGISFAGCKVDGNAMLLPPGEAFRGAMGGIDIARAVLATMCCGMLQAGLETALAYSAERRAFGRATVEFQGLQWLLADIATDLEAARLLSLEAARRFDDGEDVTLAAAHAKKFATRVALARLADCMQIMGANGAKADYPLARHFAAAKLAQFMDGTSEIQNVVIARQLLKRVSAG